MDLGKYLSDSDEDQDKDQIQEMEKDLQKKEKNVHKIEPSQEQSPFKKNKPLPSPSLPKPFQKTNASKLVPPQVSTKRSNINTEDSKSWTRQQM